MKKVTGTIIIIISAVMLITSSFQFIKFILGGFEEVLFFRFMKDGIGFVLAALMLFSGILLFTDSKNSILYSVAILICSGTSLLLTTNSTLVGINSLCAFATAPILFITATIMIIGKFTKRNVRQPANEPGE